MNNTTQFIKRMLSRYGIIKTERQKVCELYGFPFNLIDHHWVGKTIEAKSLSGFNIGDVYAHSHWNKDEKLIPFYRITKLYQTKTCGDLLDVFDGEFAGYGKNNKGITKRVIINDL